jgi:hypothetical protein
MVVKIPRKQIQKQQQQQQRLIAPLKRTPAVAAFVQKPPPREQLQGPWHIDEIGSQGEEMQVYQEVKGVIVLMKKINVMRKGRHIQHRLQHVLPLTTPELPPLLKMTKLLLSLILEMPTTAAMLQRFPTKLHVQRRCQK